MIIAIDGGAATGKSATAKLLANKLNYIHLNSGLLYRAFTYVYFIDNKLSHLDSIDITIFENFSIKMSGDNLDEIICNNSNITKYLYNKNITNYINLISNNVIIRNKINKIQQNIVKDKNIVCEGRDIGTVVFPKAQYKFFLTADINVRVKRRYEQYSKNNINISKNEVQKMIVKRDENDINRKNSPLIKANDAIVIDTSNMSIKEQVIYIYNKIKMG